MMAGPQGHQLAYHRLTSCPSTNWDCLACPAGAVNQRSVGICPGKEGLEAAKIQPDRRQPRGSRCHTPQSSQARCNEGVEWEGSVPN